MFLIFSFLFLFFWSLADIPLLAAAGASLVLQMKKMKTGSMHMCWITMPGAGAGCPPLLTSRLGPSIHCRSTAPSAEPIF